MSEPEKKGHIGYAIFSVQLLSAAGEKFLECRGTKGRRADLKILPRGGTGRDSQNSGQDGPGQPKSRTGHGTKRDRAEKDVLKQENDVLKQEKNVLKQENDVQKQEIWLFLLKIFNSFCPRTSRDRGVFPGKFAPASRPVETLL